VLQEIFPIDLTEAHVSDEGTTMPVDDLRPRKEWMNGRTFIPWCVIFEKGDVKFTNNQSS